MHELRLTEYEGVQSGGHPEQMPDGVVTGIRVDMRRKRLSVRLLSLVDDLEDLRQPDASGLPILIVRIQFRAVTRGEDDYVSHVKSGLLEKAGQCVPVYRQSLKALYWRRVMTYARYQEIQSTLP